MAFSVTPSNQVVINGSDAGIDDFLMCELQDRSRLFVRQTPGRFSQLVFDEELLPPGLEALSVRTARSVLRGMDNHEREALRTVYENRTDASLDLLTMVARELRHEIAVRPKRVPGQPPPGHINIGDTMQANLQRRIGPINLRIQGEEWVAESPIIKITPVDRFNALVWQAASDKT